MMSKEVVTSFTAMTSRLEDLRAGRRISQRELAREVDPLVPYPFQQQRYCQRVRHAEAGTGRSLPERADTLVREYVVIAACLGCRLTTRIEFVLEDAVTEGITEVTGDV